MTSQELATELSLLLQSWNIDRIEDRDIETEWRRVSIVFLYYLKMLIEPRLVQGKSHRTTGEKTEGLLELIREPKGLL